MALILYNEMSLAPSNASLTTSPNGGSPTASNTSMVSGILQILVYQYAFTLLFSALPGYWGFCHQTSVSDTSAGCLPVAPATKGDLHVRNQFNEVFHKTPLTLIYCVFVMKLLARIGGCIVIPQMKVAIP